jgi:hypothetical protein
VVLEPGERNDIELLAASYERAMPGVLDAPEWRVSTSRRSGAAADAHARGDDHSAV